MKTQLLKTLAASSLLLSSSVFALPLLHLEVSDVSRSSTSAGGELLLEINWGFDSGPQCAEGECITRIDIDLTAGDGESNARFRRAEFAIEQTRGIPTSDISYLIQDSPDPNDDDNSVRNLLSFFFNPMDTFDQDNGLDASFRVRGLGGNDAEDFYRVDREVLATAYLGNGATGNGLFGECDTGACAYIEFSDRPVAVAEPGTIALLSIGLLGLGFSRRQLLK